MTTLDRGCLQCRQCGELAQLRRGVAGFYITCNGRVMFGNLSVCCETTWQDTEEKALAQWAAMQESTPQAKGEEDNGDDEAW